MHSQTLSEVIQAEWREAYDAVRFLRRIDREIAESRSQPTKVLRLTYGPTGAITGEYTQEYRG